MPTSGGAAPPLLLPERDGGAPTLSDAVVAGVLLTVSETEGVAPVDSEAVEVGAPLGVPLPHTVGETEGLAPGESD